MRAMHSISTLGIAETFKRFSSFSTLSTLNVGESYRSKTSSKKANSGILLWRKNPSSVVISITESSNPWGIVEASYDAGNGANIIVLGDVAAEGASLDGEKGSEVETPADLAGGVIQ